MVYGTPWEIVRPEHTTEVPIYGHVENVCDDSGNSRPQWVGSRKILGVPYDIPIPGFGTETVNFLRLWESRATEEFDFEAFNSGGYEQAVHQKNMAETVSKVLYPNDKTEVGKELRLVQQYFFVACCCATSSAASTRAIPIGRPFQRKSPSSSTTHIQPSRSSNSCVSCKTTTASRGTNPGRSSPALSPTRITLSFPKLWRNGAWTFPQGSSPPLANHF